MTRVWIGLLGAALALGGCAGGPTASGGFREPGQVEQSGAGIYRLTPEDRGRVQFRMLDGINALRQARGTAPLALDPALIAAAETHSRDMALQNRPWHFGSDGSSPLDRVARAGYPGSLVGEAISETYESEIETLTAWMEDDGSAAVVLDPAARQMGIGWFQQQDGKLWWTLVTGRPGAAGPGGAGGAFGPIAGL